MSEIDQDLARAGLWSVELHDLGGDLAGLIIDASLVFLGDRHCEGLKRRIRNGLQVKGEEDKEEIESYQERDKD